MVSSFLFDLAGVAGKSASARAATVCRGKRPSRLRVAMMLGEATADEACLTDFHPRKDERTAGEGVEGDDVAHSISRDLQVIASDALDVVDEREPIPDVWCCPPPAPRAGLFRRDLSCPAATGHWRSKMSQSASLSPGGLAADLLRLGAAAS